MIRYLAIQRLAVIDAVEIEFESGFNVLTGETGAGKSILVEALGLLLGSRASSDLVRTGEDHAAVQAVFEAPDGTERVVRREVTAHGRSRAYVDGNLVTTATLREVGGELADLHGQHEHQRLLDPRSHLDLLDAWAGLDEQRGGVARAYHALREARAACDRNRSTDRDRSDRLDAARFQLGEIERVAPRPDEDDELASARAVLAAADRLQRLCDECYALLYERDESALAALRQIWRRIDSLAELDPAFRTYVELQEPITAQLEDLAHFLRSYVADINDSPGRLQEVEARLAQLEGLKRRYGPTLADVLTRQADLRLEIDEIESTAGHAAALEARHAAARAAFLEQARELSGGRKAAAAGFARTLARSLAELAMEGTRFDVRFDGTDAAEDDWHAHGFDVAEFYLSPNPGEDLRPLARTVSGGELSRIMLAVRTLASTDAPGRTLVFDEVDAGIGGRVADVVGRQLRALGNRYQVLCVTHLPQIAAFGTTHYRIEKSLRGRRTVTRVTGLDEEARVEEIARMMGGAGVTDTVRAGARDLLASRQSEYKPKGESERAKAKGRRIG